MINSLNWQSISRQHEELRLIMFFKIVNKLVELPMPDYIISAPRPTRGNNMKFVQLSINVNPYKYSFSLDQSVYGTNYLHVIAPYLTLSTY